MPIQLTFRKTGKEIKAALGTRIEGLQGRLAKRNESLDLFMEDKKIVRSYLVRTSQPDYGHGMRGTATLYGQHDISSEQKQEVAQLCRRIFELEQEIHQLSLIRTHLIDSQTFDLTFQDLVSYGFEYESGLRQEPG